MKKQIYLIILFAAMSSIAASQTNINIGGGYFGHTLTYGGFVLEAEAEQVYSEQASLPIRIDVGYYSHPRYHYGTFIDVNFGFRQYMASGFFFEESAGIGALQAFLHSDAVYQVDETGTVSEATRRLPVDLMPSITLGFGYRMERSGKGNNLIWMRPKIFWQLPHKTSSTYNLALQAGFTHTLAGK